MLEKLIALLRPSVSTEVKLTGISLFIGRILDKIETRIAVLNLASYKKVIRGIKEILLKVIRATRAIQEKME